MFELLVGGSAEEVRITTPARRTYALPGSGPVRFVDTGTPGVYVVEQFAGRQRIGRQSYVVALRSAAESDLAPRPEAAALGQAAPSAAPALTTPTALVPAVDYWEWWRALALAALGVLVLEWWWFHRRLA